MRGLAHSFPSELLRKSANSKRDSFDLMSENQRGDPLALMCNRSKQSPNARGANTPRSFRNIRIQKPRLKPGRVGASSRDGLSQP